MLAVWELMAAVFLLVPLVKPLLASLTIPAAS
jgi:hypothetical protein